MGWFRKRWSSRRAHGPPLSKCEDGRDLMFVMGMFVMGMFVKGTAL